MARPYAYRRIRRYFTVFFVPVVPLAGERRFVQCGFCRRAFDPTILEVEGESAADGPGQPERRSPDPELAGAPASALLVWDGDGTE